MKTISVLSLIAMLSGCSMFTPSGKEQTAYIACGYSFGLVDCPSKEEANNEITSN